MTDLQLKAKVTLVEWYNKKADAEGLHPGITVDDVFVVWFAKTLQNWKALLATTLPDGKYYELTYNGNDCVTYLDEYDKLSNTEIPEDPIVSLRGRLMGGL